MTKLQITLTDQEAGLLASRAIYLGYDITKYAKFILAREAEQLLSNIPSFSAGSAMEKLIDNAIAEDVKSETKVWSLGKHDN